MIQYNIRTLGKNEWDFLELVTFGLHMKAVSTERLHQMDLQAVRKWSKYHMLGALVYDAIEPALKVDQTFAEAYPQLLTAWREKRDKALRKNMLLDAARKQLFRYMEAEGIWYMPLKGSIIKDLYKKPGMREMSDNDILFDPAYSRKIRFYMEEHGYQTESYGVGAHDTYLKEPVYNFEMHRVLFSEKPGAEWNQYYQDVKDRLIKDGSNSFGYHFEENDLYIYVIAHAYKHHKGSGTGIRTLADCYILNEAYVDHFDYEYIGQELAVFGASEFEQTLRSLAHKIFASEDMGRKNRLTEQERELLTELMYSGTYGTVAGMVERSLKELQADGGTITTGTKWRYMWRRLFPDMGFYKEYVPVVYHHKILLPFYTVFRWGRGLIKNRKKITEEIKAIRKK